MLLSTVRQSLVASALPSASPSFSSIAFRWTAVPSLRYREGKYSGKTGQPSISMYYMSRVDIKVMRGRLGAPVCLCDLASTCTARSN
jgi:hypothetical protein